jgi:DNA-binding beta-propeller fold protein YncE
VDTAAADRAATADRPPADAAAADRPADTGPRPEAGAAEAGAAEAGASGDASNAFRPTLFLDLPANVCNTPDGMRLDPKTGDIILACPNFFGRASTDPNAAFTAPPVLMKITPANQLEMYFSNLPAPAHAPMRAGPMGLDFGPDGHLYIADHQYRYNTDFKSRVLRVNVDSTGKPTGADVVVEGLRLANAVMWSKDYLYVSDTWAFEGADMGKSAIYRFTRAELAAATTASPIRITKPTGTSMDSHMFAQFTSVPNRGINLAGADGITFDAQGNLYTGNFGDGVMTKITFDSQGNKATQTEFVKDPKMTCVDGIFFDARSSNIYVADSQKNAIQVVTLAGAVTTLWENDDTNGAMGLLDQPAEPLVRGDDLIIVNFDSGFAATQPAKNKAHDAPHTISVIKLR